MKFTAITTFFLLLAADTALASSMSKAPMKKSKTEAPSLSSMPSISSEPSEAPKSTKAPSKSMMSKAPSKSMKMGKKSM